jgi:flagellar operon protein
VNAQDQARLETAVDELSQRGAKESLVLMDDRAYVVGVPKRTVITVMSREEAMGQVFTNIDSTYVSM